MQSSKTPKNDQRAALREAQFERRSALRHAQSHQPAKPVTLAPVAEKIAKAKEAVNKVSKGVNKNADHQAKWRKANPELSRERVRNSMRKLREKAT